MCIRDSPVPDEVAAQQRPGRLPAPVPVEPASSGCLTRGVQVPALLADARLDEVVLEQARLPQRGEVVPVEPATVVEHPRGQPDLGVPQVRPRHAWPFFSEIDLPVAVSYTHLRAHETR